MRLAFALIATVDILVVGYLQLACWFDAYLEREYARLDAEFLARTPADQITYL